jgi:hypothetical protein
VEKTRTLYLSDVRIRPITTKTAGTKAIGLVPRAAISVNGEEAAGTLELDSGFQGVTDGQTNQTSSSTIIHSLPATFR